MMLSKIMKVSLFCSLAVMIISCEQNYPKKLEMRTTQTSLRKHETVNEIQQLPADTFEYGSNILLLSEEDAKNWENSPEVFYEPDAIAYDKNWRKEELQRELMMRVPWQETEQ